MHNYRQNQYSGLKVTVCWLFAGQDGNAITKLGNALGYASRKHPLRDDIDTIVKWHTTKKSCDCG